MHTDSADDGVEGSGIHAALANAPMGTATRVTADGSESSDNQSLKLANPLLDDEQSSQQADDDEEHDHEEAIRRDNARRHECATFHDEAFDEFHSAHLSAET